MEIKEQYGDILFVFELLFNREKVKKLMDNIVKDCCFKEKGEFHTYENGEAITVLNKDSALEEVTNIRNSAGMYLYEDIDKESISLKSNSEDANSYNVYFKATKNVLPNLYFLLKRELC